MAKNYKKHHFANSRKVENAKQDKQKGKNHA